MISVLFKIRRLFIDKIAVLKGHVVILLAWIVYRNRIRIGSGLRIYGPLPILHCAAGGQILLGDNIVMRNSTRHNYIGVLKPTSIVSLHGGIIRIGSYVGFSGASICAHSSILIKDYATIGANAFIVDSDFHSLDSSVREVDSRLGREPDMALVGSKPVVIGERAFVGLNCVILKGANIGDGSVIGAGTLIAGMVPGSSIATGQKHRILNISVK
jgi:acetyltransferase-like isoleucine patch superfamily enzyme